MARLDRVIGTNIIYVKDEEIRLGHTWHEVDIIEDIINRENPQWFIEVGVHEGGLSWLIIPQHIELKYLGVELHTDLTQPIVKKIYQEYNQELFGGDCFNTSLMGRVASLPHKMIYCDGGNKIAELLSYKFCCNPGDLIFCHDYHDGKRRVRELAMNDVHPEVCPADVQHIDNDKTFERYPESYLKETRIAGWRKL